MVSKVMLFSLIACSSSTTFSLSKEGKKTASITGAQNSRNALFRPATCVRRQSEAARAPPSVG